MSLTPVLEQLAAIAAESDAAAVEAGRALWRAVRRPEQAEPSGKWAVWLIQSGRGWGKTRVGAETVRDWVNSGRYKRLNLVARTAADVRDTMIEGESGLLACCACDVDNRPVYNPSKRSLTWPNGAKALLFSADEPDALRGTQCEAWWSDEVACWKYMREAWDMLQFGARLGQDVRGIVTTTPRPVQLIKDLIARPDVVVTRGSTYDNQRNLAPSFLAMILTQYEGTRMGRQEIDGQILDDNPNALWKRLWIDENRVERVPDLARVVVAVDPAATARASSDETGIIAAGMALVGRLPHYYLLGDYSMRGSPLEWGRAAAAAYSKHRADRVIYETNQGGDMAAQTLLSADDTLPVQGVHASRGKITRAEPIAALYEQGRVHHVGFYAALEDQMCEWDAASGDSPDRMDAAVWALTALGAAGVADLSQASRAPRTTRATATLAARF